MLFPKITGHFHDPLSPFGEVSYWWNQIVANSKTQLYMGLGISI